jgi:oxygen-independent coproporphyrinogen-3 oxidase
VEQQVVFDSKLIQRYDKSGPRYTSYPTAVQFHEGVGDARYRAFATASNDDPIPRSLSLYFHIPFCATVCYYCACNKIVTKNRGHASAYVSHLQQEIALQGKLFDRDRTVNQLHWGGGTPTFLNQGQMRTLMRTTAKHFHLLDGDRGEYSIEVDPRTVNESTLVLLRELGFNRISLGVQDFDPYVQKAVNRIQSEIETMDVIEAARKVNFRSVNIDLIYGLPHQSVESFARTLEKIIAASPDRVAVYNYAHLPDRFKSQRQINESDLPSPAVKLDILQHTIEQLTGAGYLYIGMDHFARPGDELAVAQRNGTLHRNFQGYSAHSECDIIGIGITSIGRVCNCYSQNVKDIEEYYGRLDARTLPVERGIAFDDDDQLRREVINQLMCHFTLDIAALEKKAAISFGDYFATEISALRGMQRDGLLELDESHIHVLPAGRLLVRNVCMAFDRYLRAAGARHGYSRVI